MCTEESSANKAPSAVPDRRLGEPSGPSPSDRLNAIYRDDFEELHAALCRLKYRRLSPDDAQEALQNAFLVLSERHRRSGFWPDDVKAWLVRVAVIQSRRRSRRPAISLDAPAGNASEAGLLRLLSDSEAVGPSTALTREETLSVMKQALEDLPGEVRGVVESHILTGKSFAEIALEQDLTEENAKKICQRGLSRIHEYLGRYSSTMVPEADANTYRPRTRKGAIEAIRTLPPEYASVLEARYVSDLTLEQCASLAGLSIEAVSARLTRAEELIERKYGFSPEELVAVLRRAG